MDRLLVDLDENGCVSVSTCLDGELPGTATTSGALAWPWDSEKSEDLRWYLEDYLRAPFGVYEDRGSRIANELPEWGRAMFSALFGMGPARDAYVTIRSRAVRPGATEIVLRSAVPAWLGLPWELLHDPKLPTHVVLDGVGISRSLPTAQWGPSFAVEGSRLRVLMVISRPRGADDVRYQMIARPLLRRLAAVHGDIDLVVLRPPTLDALIETLREARAAGSPFQIVHFDGHGMFSGARAGAGAGAPWSYGQPAGEGVLVFEKPGGGADEVPADRIGQVLGEAQVPVVVLNACQSGAVGKQLEATVATRLLAGGASAVVAMAYSVYAVAAAEFMAAFYERLFTGDTVGDAVLAGRARMASSPKRPSPKGEVKLKDWVIPVHYLRREVRFPDLRIRPAARAEVTLEAALDALRASNTSHQGDLLAPVGEFVGRDGLFYTLEVAARTQRVVLVHGPGGTGKSELAKAFGRWWRDTGGVERPEWVIWHSFEPGVASFGLDGVISAIGLAVYGVDFALQELSVRRDLVHQVLRERRLLLVWDNFESACSMPKPTSATPPLDAAAKNELRNFLHEVATGGRSAVLVTSRTPETWLGELRRIELGGLTREEAVEYADHVLHPYPAARPRRKSRAFAELLEWLDGHPLSMRLLLPHLDTTDPAVLLAGLRGTRTLPDSIEDGRTTSLPASITYSITHLDPTARRLLVALSLCVGVADATILSVFSRDEHVPNRFRGIDFHGWKSVLHHAAEVGLLTARGGTLYGIHPALPAYLAWQWNAEDSEIYTADRAAAERALLNTYSSLGAWLHDNITSDDAAHAYQMIGLHRRMLGHMLGFALRHRRWSEAQKILQPLELFWRRDGLTVEAQGWADRVRLTLEDADGNPPPLDQPAGSLWLFMVNAHANRLHLAGQMDAAEASYVEIREMLLAQPESKWQRARLATITHQLGILVQDRGRIDEAEQWYRQSFTINEELGDRTNMADSYQQFGAVALKRGRLDEAEQWYRRSLTINDELSRRPGIGVSCHQLGILAQLRGRLDEAEQWYRRSLVINEELGDRPSTSGSYHNLGILAQLRGRPDEAEQWYLRSLTINEELSDRPRIRASYHELGTVAQSRGRLDEAEQWYRRSLTIKEELGDRPGMSLSYHQLGTVAQRRGRLDEAEQWYRRSLTINEELSDRPAMARTYAQMGLLAELRGEIREALEWMVRCVTLFDEFPHPATDPGPSTLTRLTTQLGLRILEEIWSDVTGAPLPTGVLKFIQDGGTAEENNE
ncbi:tetratricopeptide repeat protein [Amycolatopsis sp. DG1A-15b]|uniref:CHAT domain-containing tetratricopeptide repeat protein n=1 Tax=Amycolatopsis sp. DG1A-15b TaxID=3052846 RepID=UPI00255BE8A6|nr:tetratricopeptide repeat protein [Amycolatopsis sp. DG1A-15b]WIX85689.1 tetratricopeptide repeat protein [Amycolatopsis sp. DG1A-15b]